MNIEVIEKLSESKEDENFFALNFVFSNDINSSINPTLVFLKEETIEVYEALLNAADYMKKHMVEKNISRINEV